MKSVPNPGMISSASSAETEPEADTGASIPVFRRKANSGILLMGPKQKRGIDFIEAYPTPFSLKGKKQPAAFSWTGPMKIFEEASFELVQRLSHASPLLEKKF